MKETENERRLWRAVLDLAMADLKIPAYKSALRRWFEADNAGGDEPAGSFAWVCDVLGLDRDAVLGTLGLSVPIKKDVISKYAEISGNGNGSTKPEAFLNEKRFRFIYKQPDDYEDEEVISAYRRISATAAESNGRISAGQIREIMQDEGFKANRPDWSDVISAMVGNGEIEEIE
jgi:hypothetical protein